MNRRALLVSCCLLLLLAPLGCRAAQWDVTQTHFFSDLTLLSPQGVAFNEEEKTWLISGRDVMFETDPAREFHIVQKVSPAVPRELSDMGYWHLGDVSVCDGNVFLPIEKHGYGSGAIAKASLDTLQFQGEYGLTVQSHLPWVAVDCASELAYSSEFDNVDHINVYRFQDLFSATTNHTLVEPWRTVNLTRTVQHVQGGEYFGGMIFLSTNEETERPVYIFDASTGQLVESFGTVAGGEGEGLGIVPPAAPSGGQWPGLIVGHTKHVLGVPVGADYMLYQRRAQ